MNIDNFITLLDRFMDRRPFRPFTVSMVNGDRFEVDHPKSVVYRRGVGVAVYLSPGGAPVFFDNEGVCELTDDLKEAVKNSA